MKQRSPTIEATFCFIDVAGFTALTEAHGDEVAADLIEHFGALVDEALAEPGQLINVIGDAVLVSYPTPAAAVDFAMRLFARAAAEPDFPALRAGLHHGSVVERDGRMFGTTLNLAARVAAQAGGGQVLVTEAVADAVRASHLEVERMGTFTLRNLRDPVELFRVSPRGAESSSVLDPVCRMLVEPDGAPARLRYEGTDYWFCSLDCAAKFAASPQAYAAGAGSS